VVVPDDHPGVFGPFSEHSESVSAVAVTQSHRSLYAGLTLAVAAVATACAFVVARATGGSDAPASVVAGLVGVVSLLGLLPVLVRKAEYFGMAVLGASIARMLLAMFAAVMLTEVGGLESRPVWLGVVAGAGLMLVAESAGAIAVLSSIERKKAGLAGAESSSTC
jgi:heme A synthase